MCIVIDLDVVCLVCLHHSQQMHDIFEPDAETPDLQIAHKISTLSKLKVSADNESLPNKICDNCLEDLRAAWRFHKNCQTAVVVFQSILKPRLQKLQEKLEEEEEEAQTEESPVAHKTEELDTELSEHMYNDEVGHNISNVNYTEEEQCNESMEDIQPLANDDLALEDCSQDLDKNETEVLTLKDTSSEYLNMHQNIVDEDFLSVTETVEEDQEEEEEEEGEESDIVEYYLTDEGLQQQLDELTRKPTTSKAVEKLPSLSGFSRKSLLKIKNEDKLEIPQRSENIKQYSTRKQSKLLLKNKNSSEIEENLGDTVKGQKQTKSQKQTKRRLTPELKAPKTCDLCGNSYRYQHALNAHMRRHFKQKPFPCELCDKAFVSNVELRRHMRVHTGHKPYACQYCDRRFSDFGSRIKHERTHTGERPYKCMTCGKSFAYPHVLTVHLRTHTGEKRFQCQICPKGFTKKSYLITHMYQHHPENQEGNGRGREEAHSTSELSMDCGEENEMRSNAIKQKFNNCIYSEEYVEESADHESQERHEDSQEDDEDTMLIHDQHIINQTKHKLEDEDSEIDEVVEVHLDDYTIRVR